MAIRKFLTSVADVFAYDDKGNKLVLYIFSKYYILIICLFIISMIINNINGI